MTPAGSGNVRGSCYQYAALQRESNMQLGNNNISVFNVKFTTYPLALKRALPLLSILSSAVCMQEETDNSISSLHTIFT